MEYVPTYGVQIWSTNGVQITYLLHQLMGCFQSWDEVFSNNFKFFKIPNDVNELVKSSHVLTEAYSNHVSGLMM